VLCRRLFTQEAKPPTSSNSEEGTLDVTTKMHIALALMLTAYIVPMVYLVRLARLEIRRTEKLTQTERRTEHSVPGNADT